MYFLCFNEAALLPLPDSNDSAFEYTRLETYMKTFEEAWKKGFKKIRYDSQLEEIYIATGRSLGDCIQEGINSDSNSYRVFAAFLLSSFDYPVIDDDSKEEEDFIKNYFHVQKDERVIPVNGLAAAYLYTVPAMHFLSLDDFWNRVAYDLVITGEEEENARVVSISIPTALESVEYRQWEEENRNVELIECMIPPEEKSISLRDDHGREVLKDFSDKIVRSPHVIRVINSLPFNPYQRKFIKNISEDGCIEIVLTNTDRGLGVVIQTTGRNYKETEHIARILKLKYSREK